MLDYFARRPRVGVMIDVGAQFGTSFKPYLKLGWRVVAFEPDSTKLDKLRVWLAHPQMTFYRAAVGEVAREGVQFYTSNESNGISSLVPFRASHSPSEKVDVMTLATVLHKLGIDKIDYLKIDTEGYDLAVLKGHNWSILPEVVMCEFDEIKTRPLGHTYQTIADLLVLRGYEVWCSQWAPLVKYGSGHAWHSFAKYPNALHHPDAWGNFVAVRGGEGAKVMEELIAPHL